MFTPDAITEPFYDRDEYLEVFGCSKCTVRRRRRLREASHQQLSHNRHSYPKPQLHELAIDPMHNGLEVVSFARVWRL